jgi:hypothetical protein
MQRRYSDTVGSATRRDSVPDFTYEGKEIEIELWANPPSRVLGWGRLGGFVQRLALASPFPLNLLGVRRNERVTNAAMA